jgi:hypothetical protein
VTGLLAGVISRDQGEPWGPTGMTTAKWRDVPVVDVVIAELIATQPGVLFSSLSDAAPGPVGGDPFPHVIAWRGGLYLEDGHHRVVRAALRGETTVRARMLEVADQVAKGER